MTPTDPFGEGKQTLIIRDQPGEEFEREETDQTQETLERSEVVVREELLFKGMSKSETNRNSRRKEKSSLVMQGTNAMMSSISPREEQPISTWKRSFKTMYDERMTSLRTDGLSFGYVDPGLMHSDTGFTPSPRQEKSKKALYDSLTRPM